MRIISKFKDYYDCGQAFGIDPKIVYRRISGEDHCFIETPKDLIHYKWKGHTFWDGGDRLFIRNKDTSRTARIFAKSYWIFLAGKQYQFFDVTYEDKEERFSLLSTRPEFNDYFTPTDRGKEFLRQNGQPSKVNDNLDCPVILGYTNFDNDSRQYLFYIEKNPCLADYGFQFILDPYEVFNEISMWFGKKNQERDIPAAMTEQQKVEQHGFHYKQSFRNRKD